MSTLTLKRKRQVFTVSNGKVADPAKNPSGAVLDPEPAKAPKPKKQKAGKVKPAPTKPKKMSDREKNYKILVDHWPGLFSFEGARLPMKIGVLKDILKTKIATSDVIKLALRNYVRHREYQEALVQGGRRYDLNGREAGEVTEKQQRLAMANLERRKQVLRERRERKKEKCRLKKRNQRGYKSTNEPTSQPAV